MESKKDKQFYLMIKNTLTGKVEKVFVTEEVYRAYKSFDRAEKKQKQRVWRCRIPRDEFKNQKSFLKRCNHKCDQCPYGIQAKDSVVSLEALEDENAEYADYSYDPATALEEQEEREELSAELQAAIEQLSPEQQSIARLHYFEGKSETEIAKTFNISVSAICQRLAVIEKKLKKLLEKP